MWHPSKCSRGRSQKTKANIYLGHHRQSSCRGLHEHVTTILQPDTGYEIRVLLNSVDIVRGSTTSFRVSGFHWSLSSGVGVSPAAIQPLSSVHYCDGSSLQSLQNIVSTQQMNLKRGSQESSIT